MKDFLRKIGLIDTLKMELPIGQSEFMLILQNNIDEPGTDFGDVFSSSKNHYKGKVDYDGFELKRKATFFTSRMNFTKAKGVFAQKNGKLVIDTEINGFSNQMKFFYGFVLIFYPFFLFVFFFANSVVNKLFFIPFIVVHFTGMIAIPYFMMKRSVSQMKYDLEREVYFMIRK